MIDANLFLKNLNNNGASFFTGVPDSLLKEFCACVFDNCDKTNHVLAANEGGAVGIAAGYHLATKKIPVVYMQNSGIGNAINPLLSLADKEVYAIPMILVIGWRGAPGKKDEPQHIKQGRIQSQLLDALELPFEIIDPSTSEADVFNKIKKLSETATAQSRPVALVVKAGTFFPYKPTATSQTNDYPMQREDAIAAIVDLLKKEDIVVSTTGKASRELYELREKLQQGHQNDFLTVGSMGHSSQIALGIALQCERRIVCIDGDGASLMHLGAMAISGTQSLNNFFHILLNNGAHESVGGQPTVGLDIDFTTIANSCGYEEIHSVSEKNDLKEKLVNILSQKKCSFLEIKVACGSRTDLGRPKSSPLENKIAFMDFIRK